MSPGLAGEGSETPPAGHGTPAGRGPAPAAVTAGVKWGVIDQGVQVVVRFATTVVLAHLLLPHDFGLFGLVFVVVNFALVLSGLGLGSAIVQRRDLRPDHTTTAFTASSGFGIVLAGLVAASAVPVASYFHEPRLRVLVVAIAGTFFLRGLELIPNDLLLRAGRFRSYYLSSTFATVLSCGAGLVAGVAGAGVWALMVMAISESFLATAIGWVFAVHDGVWRPRVGFDRRAMGELAGFSAYLTASRLVDFGNGNGDNIVVGRVLGATALGYYSLAYRVMLLPLQRFGEIVSASAFPALATVQDDVERLRDGYFEAMRLMAAITFPLTIGIAVVAPAAVPALLGSKWDPSIQTVQILALAGPLTGLNRLTSILTRAIGRVEWTFWVNLCSVVVYIPAFVIGAHWGIRGVAVSFGIATVITAVPEAWIVMRGLRVGATAVLRPLLPVTTATAAMALVAAGALAPLSGADPLVRLAAAGSAGGLVYVVLLWRLAPETLSTMAHMLRPGDGGTGRG